MYIYYLATFWVLEYLEPLAYLKPCQTLTRHIQNRAIAHYSPIFKQFRTLYNHCLCRNLPYSESWMGDPNAPWFPGLLRPCSSPQFHCLTNVLPISFLLHKRKLQKVNLLVYTIHCFYLKNLWAWKQACCGEFSQQSQVHLFKAFLL